MNDKLLQKKGRIISQIAAELLGKEENDRFMPIMYYQEKFNASQGTIQNAINFLKEKGAIKLRNKGYQGSYIQAIDYEILKEYCEPKTISGSMPLPHDVNVEVLACYLKQSLQNKNLHVELSYQQDVQHQIEGLIDGVYDFIVCSLTMAKTCQETYPELIRAVTFDNGSLLEQAMLIHTTDSDIQTVSVIRDDPVLKEIGIHYAMNQNLPLELISRRELLAKLDTREPVFAVVSKYDAYTASDISSTQLTDDTYLDDTTAVVLTHQKNEEVNSCLLKYIHIEDYHQMKEAFKAGNLELQY